VGSSRLGAVLRVCVVAPGHEIASFLILSKHLHFFNLSFLSVDGSSLFTKSKSKL